MGNFVQKHAEAVALFAKVTLIHVCFTDKISAKEETVIEQIDQLTSCIIYIKKTQNNIPVIRDVVRLCKIIRAYRFGYKQMFRNEAPDIIHANILIPIGLIAYLFSKIKKIPYIITEHWTGYLPGDPNKPGHGMLFYRYFAKKAACIAPVTQNLAKAMQSFGIRNQYSVIPNVVDTAVFTMKEPSTDSRKHLLHVSSLLDEHKNFSGMLLAVKHVKESGHDCVLEVISDGDFEQYHKKIEDLGLSGNIIFHGKKTTAEVAGIMKHCDVLLLFSNYENFPCVIPEAWACGLPVLSSNVGGISEFVNKTNGAMTEAKNIRSFSRKLDDMLHKLDKFDKRKIRDYAMDNFSYQVIGSQYIDLYKKVLKN